MKDASKTSSLRSRVGWFALLYFGSVLAVFVLATALHMLLRTRL